MNFIKFVNNLFTEHHSKRVALLNDCIFYNEFYNDHLICPSVQVFRTFSTFCEISICNIDLKLGICIRLVTPYIGFVFHHNRFTLTCFSDKSRPNSFSTFVAA